MALASSKKLRITHEIPALPLRDVVVFPNIVIPLFVGRARSIKALESAIEKDLPIFLVAQKNAGTDDPGVEDVYQFGCIGRVLQMLKLPDGTVKVLIEGVQRAHLVGMKEVDGFYVAQLAEITSTTDFSDQLEGMIRVLLERFEQFAQLNKKVSPEIIPSLSEIKHVDKLIDTIVGNIAIPLERKQDFIETLDTQKRYDMLLSLIDGEIEIMEIEKRIRGRVKRQMEKNQREYYLNEQVKAIQKELNDGEDGSELEELARKISHGKLPKEVRKKLESELKKLKQMSPMAAEASVVRNYLDTVLNLPWKKRSKISTDLRKAEEILEAEHYGLEKVKERILEYLAVQQRVDKVKAPILCLVGPPGVGKTSLGQSIARATNRKFIRMALGGVRDEAEIRGHRRTYIGSMPGKVLQNLTKVAVSNPFFLLDEVDKLGQDFRGDPASALLEVLDPEQNHTFQDHYVEVDFDLSDVMFVATANSLNIPPALLDRMEVIRLSGYTEDEKLNIAKRYLVPKQIENNGLKNHELTIGDDALMDIIRYYTREAGVRSLEREISKICRKAVRLLTLKKVTAPLVVGSDNLEQFLGVHRFDFGRAQKENQIGQVNGLAYTEVGGDLLTIEAALMPGKGLVLRTGSLGDVMKESVEAARTVVRSRSEVWGIDHEQYEKRDIHIHVPEGATPKDGPSAGAAMTVAMVSVLTAIPVKADVAMTGEITLRGEVLAIGGLKEKLLAAHRAGIKTVIIPEDNFKDLTEIPKIVQEEMTIVPVKWIDQVLDVALECSPEERAIEKAKLQEKDSENKITEEVLPVTRKKPRTTTGVQKH